MTRTRLFFLASVLLCIIALPAFVGAQDQTTPPADTKPASDAQSSDTKPADAKPVEAKPATDTKPADAKPAGTKLPIKAALVLTPEFCATKIKPKGPALT